MPEALTIQPIKLDAQNADSITKVMNELVRLRLVVNYLADRIAEAAVGESVRTNASIDSLQQSQYLLNHIEYLLCYDGQPVKLLSRGQTMENVNKARNECKEAVEAKISALEAKNRAAVEAAIAPQEAPPPAPLRLS